MYICIYRILHFKENSLIKLIRQTCHCRNIPFEVCWRQLFIYHYFYWITSITGPLWGKIHQSLLCVLAQYVMGVGGPRPFPFIMGFRLLFLFSYKSFWCNSSSLANSRWNGGVWFSCCGHIDWSRFPAWGRNLSSVRIKLIQGMRCLSRVYFTWRRLQALLDLWVDELQCIVWFDCWQLVDCILFSGPL